MKKILFFDDFIAHYDTGILRKFHSPAWMEDKIFKDPDLPFGTMPMSIVPAQGGGYYLYYMTAISGFYSMAEKSVLCIAHSQNKIDWKVMNLMQEREPGFPQVIQKWGGPVYYDQYDPDPSKRYKMAFSNINKIPVSNGVRVESGGAKVLCSADGLEWHESGGDPFHDGISDCVLSMLYNPVTEAWQIHLRRGWGERRICMVQSHDLKKWSKPMAVLHPSPIDEPYVHFYGMPQFYDEAAGIFIGFLNILRMPYKDISAGTVYCELVYSYNGVNWNRTFRPFIDLVERGKYGGGSMYGCLMTEYNDKILIYASASIEEHHRVFKSLEAGVQYHVALPGTLRRDGFVGLTSNRGKGEVMTECLKIKSPSISLNVLAPFGGVKVQLCTTDYKPIEGYTYDECEEIRGDYLDISPVWRGDSDVTAVIEKFGEVRLQIRLEQAELFSISGDFGFNINPAAPAFENLA